MQTTIVQSDIVVDVLCCPQDVVQEDGVFSYNDKACVLLSIVSGLSKASYRGFNMHGKWIMEQVIGGPALVYCNLQLIGICDVGWYESSNCSFYSGYIRIC